MDTDDFRIAPGSEVRLGERKTDDHGELERHEAEKATAELNGHLERLQELLYAESRHRVLVVLQAMDAGGKDGTIRHVFDGVNPAGVRVASFKQPTPAELAHDYLWRVHSHVPGSGELVIFNRSHYEDVLIVRVDELVPAGRWKKRYRHIVDFERLLADEGTTIVKLFLHISRVEQKKRFEDRLSDPTKQWKFSHGDLAVRERWDDYQDAYEDAIRETSTAWAPWYVIPADKNWYRNLVVSQILVDTLEGLDMSYPEPDGDLSGLVIPD